MHRIPAARCAQFLVYLTLLIGGSAAGEEPASDEPAGLVAEPGGDGHTGRAVAPDVYAGPAATPAQSEASSTAADAAAASKDEYPSADVVSPPARGTTARPRSRRTRLVYACRDAGTPVFSDRPCGAGAYAWRLDLPPPSAAGAAPSTRAAKPAAATRPIAARDTAPAAARPPGPDRCARLSEQLARVDAQMRSGYSAGEAARLWQRWRDAKKRLHDAKC
jgi:hypothetical protein